MHNWNEYKCQSIERLRQIEKYILTDSTVLDVGAGDLSLKTILKNNCKYQPINSYKSSENTIICDLNVQYPQLSMVYDYAVCCGVCEYLYDLDLFFAWIGKHCKKLIVTYSYLEDYGKIMVKKWNAPILLKNDFLQCLQNNNFTVLHIEDTILKQKLHVCKNNNIKL